MQTMRTLLLAAALLGFGGVGLGAFAAHGLKARLSPASLAILQTGVHYQLLHAVALLAVVSLLRPSSGGLLGLAGYAFVGGTLLFSGSLYALALSGVRAFGAVAPLGGLALLGGWACLGLAAWRQAF